MYYWHVTEYCCTGLQIPMQFTDFPILSTNAVELGKWGIGIFYPWYLYVRSQEYFYIEEPKPVLEIAGTHASKNMTKHCINW